MDHDQVVRMTQMIEEAVTFGIRNGLPDAKERRRYYLLQAAAMLASGNAERYLINGGQLVAAFVITDAVDLLAEIERRES